MQILNVDNVLIFMLQIFMFLKDKWDVIEQTMTRLAVNAILTLR